MDLLKTCDTLPVLQGQPPKFPVHISYFLQKCNKGKLSKMDLPLLKNDITRFYFGHETCVL